ncbi:hypothetical protein VKT23_005901 [Stygiomarasmius scandens]|uniref:Uncharacterized protein n=1 Tax=Marasmiellus scandens TaxID=2682957 RepID=A0ABR1JNN9_9AGAR
MTKVWFAKRTLIDLLIQLLNEIGFGDDVSWVSEYKRNRDLRNAYQKGFQTPSNHHCCKAFNPTTVHNNPFKGNPYFHDYELKFLEYATDVLDLVGLMHYCLQFNIYSSLTVLLKRILHSIAIPLTIEIGEAFAHFYPTMDQNDQKLFMGLDRAI